MSINKTNAFEVNASYLKSVYATSLSSAKATRTMVELVQSAGEKLWGDAKELSEVGVAFKLGNMVAQGLTRADAEATLKLNEKARTPAQQRAAHNASQAWSYVCRLAGKPSRKAAKRAAKVSTENATPIIGANGKVVNQATQEALKALPSKSVPLNSDAINIGVRADPLGSISNLINLIARMTGELRATKHYDALVGVMADARKAIDASLTEAKKENAPTTPSLIAKATKGKAVAVKVPATTKGTIGLEGAV